MFGKKNVFHVLDDNSPVKYQGILGIDFLTRNNNFSNKSLILEGQKFKRYNHILTMHIKSYKIIWQDILVKPLINKSTTAIIRALWHFWLRYFGKPKELLSDNALEFTSNEFKTLCDKLYTKHIFISIYHP